jgi:hypothetical protein
MKLRRGFVTNSSSTSYIITNTSETEKTLVDFAKENIHLLHDFNHYYSYNYTEEEFLKSVEENNILFRPRETRICVFGDEDGTIVGHVYDYILREGGESKSWEWSFHESLR